MSTAPITFDVLGSGTPPLTEAGGPVPRRFTVAEYHRMIAEEIFPPGERVELIDGWIVEMPPIGPPHGASTSLAEAALRAVIPVGWFLRVQLPLTLDKSEPEPDLLVVRGGIRDYVERHPGADDAGLVIEVADATLAFDRRQKAQQYAAEGIAEYWIVNLIDRHVEVHQSPQAQSGAAEYRVRHVMVANQSVDVVLDGQVVGAVKVSDLLP